MVVVSVKSLFQQRKGGLVPIVYAQEIRGLILVLFVAFVISLPLTFSILFRYHLKILNPATTNWIFPLLALDSFSTFIREFLSWFSAIAWIGLFALITKSPPGQQAKTVLLSWFFICCAALALNYVQQLISPQLHLMLVPA